MRAVMLQTLVFRVTCALAGVAHAQAEPTSPAYAIEAPEPEGAPQQEATGGDSAAASSAFAQGRELMKQGLPEAACERFESSRRLHTTVAVLLNLGLCQRQLGHVATAHRFYRRAEVLATLQGDDRRDLAHEEAESLAPLRASLALQLSERLESGASLRLDGVIWEGETGTQPMFVDAGEHTLSVETAGKVIWERSIVVQDARRYVLLVPGLRGKHPAQPTAAPHLPAVERDPSLYDERPALDRGPRAIHIAALSTAGLGVVGIGAGLLFGWAAQSAFSESGHYCNDRDQCQPLGIELRDDARAQATRATVLSVAGAAALATGIVLWWLSPDDETRTSVVAPVIARASLTSTQP